MTEAAQVLATAIIAASLILSLGLVLSAPTGCVACDKRQRRILDAVDRWLTQLRTALKARNPDDFKTDMDGLAASLDELAGDDLRDEEAETGTYRG